MPDGAQYSIVYTEDANGNLTTTDLVNPGGIVTRIVYTPSGYFSGGRLSSVSLAYGRPEQSTVAYTWNDGTGLLSSITDQARVNSRV